MYLSSLSSKCKPKYIHTDNKDQELIKDLQEQDTTLNSKKKMHCGMNRVVDWRGKGGGGEGEEGKEGDGG